MADTVTIVFKSGAKVRVRADEVSIRKVAGEELRSVTWTPNAKPRPMFINLNEVAAVFEGRA